jgi:hypothetical protein
MLFAQTGEGGGRRRPRRRVVSGTQWRRPRRWRADDPNGRALMALRRRKGDDGVAKPSLNLVVGSAAVADILAGESHTSHGCLRLILGPVWVGQLFI